MIKIIEINVQLVNRLRAKGFILMNGSGVFEAVINGDSRRRSVDKYMFGVKTSDFIGSRLYLNDSGIKDDFPPTDCFVTSNDNKTYIGSWSTLAYSMGTAKFDVELTDYNDQQLLESIKQRIKACRESHKLKLQLIIDELLENSDALLYEYLTEREIVRQAHAKDRKIDIPSEYYIKFQNRAKGK